MPLDCVKGSRFLLVHSWKYNTHVPRLIYSYNIHYACVKIPCLCASYTASPPRGLFLLANHFSLHIHSNTSQDWIAALHEHLQYPPIPDRPRLAQ